MTKTPELKYAPYKFSVVLTAQQLNPADFDASFVRAIAGEHQLDGAKSPIVTPVFSQVSLASNVVFQAQPQRLDISQLHPGLPNPLHSSVVLDIGRGVARALPHTKFTALGINYHVAVQSEDPSAFLLRLFADKIAKIDPRPQPTMVQLTVVIRGVPLNLAFQPGEMRKSAESRAVSALLVSGNHHTSLPIDDGKARVAAIEAQLAETQRRFTEFEEALHLVCG